MIERVRILKTALLIFLKAGSCPDLHLPSAKRFTLAKALKTQVILFSKLNLKSLFERRLHAGKALKMANNDLQKTNHLSRFASLFFILIGVSLVQGCAPKPTKMYESKQGFSGLIQSKARKPIKVTDQTQVVDSRKRFDFTMAHYPGSSHLVWESFSQTEGRYPGRLQEDLEAARKRLQLKGLHPNRPVVIVGYGPEGNGEAGRLAWTLFYLGFDDVQIVGEQILRPSSNIVNTKQKENAKPWKLKTRPQLIASKDEVLNAVTNPKGNQRTFLIDVRSKKEYFSKEGLGKPYSLPDLGAIHIEWKEFFKTDGRPNLAMKKQLRGIGVWEKYRVIVLSNTGVRAAAVNSALLTMGYTNSATFVDGLNSLKKSLR